MAKLAEEFPGALREVDVLALEVIEARIDALARAERAPAKIASWMHAQAVFHRLMRGALTAKRWLHGRKRVTAATRAAFAEALPTLARSADAKLFLDDLDQIANPPRGRLMVVVHAKLAETLGLSEAEARALVFERRQRP
jgi:hypothetical protein